MANPQTKKVGSFTGFSSGEIATAKVPPYGTIRGIWIRPHAAADADGAIADMKSELSNIVLNVNGEEYVNATPTFLLDLQRYWLDKWGPSSNANLAGYLPIYLTYPNFADPKRQDALALGTGLDPSRPDIRSIDVQITCGTLANLTGADLYFDVTPELRPLGEHMRIRKFPRNFASTGDKAINDLPTNENTALLELHIEDGSGTITKTNVQVQNNNFLDSVPASVNKGNLQAAGRSPQSGYYHVDFNRANDTDGYLDMQKVSSLIVTPTFSVQPDNFNVYAVSVFNKGAVN